jgi:hypothetical protein
MKVQIQLEQADIEQAIRDYVAANGISSPVNEVKFNVTRKGGTGIEADVQLGDADAAQTVEQAAPAKVADSTKPSKPAPKKAEKPAPTPEPIKEEDDKVPFDADAEEKTPSKDTESANDSTEAEPTKESRKLFG